MGEARVDRREVSDGGRGADVLLLQDVDYYSAPAPGSERSLAPGVEAPRKSRGGEPGAQTQLAADPRSNDGKHGAERHDF